MTFQASSVGSCALALVVCLLSAEVRAQGDAPPPPPGDVPEAPAPPDAPAPEPTPPAPAPPPAPPPNTVPAPTTSPPAEPPPPRDDALPPLDYSSERGAVPPPEKPEGKSFEMPPWSLRVDPFNWLLEGRLGLEAEVGLLSFMSFEVVPVFVVNEKPPTFNLSGAPDVLRQRSNGIGPISGAAFDVAFWLDGKALEGYVLRFGITNEGYEYQTKDDAGEIDSLKHTERRAFGMFGSHMRWGAFTIAGGIGLGVELNKEERCFPKGATSVNQAQTKGCDKQLLVATERTDVNNGPVDLNGGLHPIYFMGRFSLGIVLD